MKRIISIVLSMLVLCGCTRSQQVTETQPAVEASTPQEISDPFALRLTQESNVRKATYEGKAAYEDFLSKAEKLFLSPGLKQVLTPQGIAVCPTT